MDPNSSHDLGRDKAGKKNKLKRHIHVPNILPFLNGKIVHFIYNKLCITSAIHEVLIHCDMGCTI